MARKALTDRTLKSLKPAARGKHYDLWDAVVPGLGVRVSDTGTKTFVLMKRYGDSKNPTRGRVFRTLRVTSKITSGSAGPAYCHPVGRRGRDFESAGRACSPDHLAGHLVRDSASAALASDRPGSAGRLGLHCSFFGAFLFE